MTIKNSRRSREDPAPRELSRTIGAVAQQWRQQMNRRLKPFGLNLSMRQVLMQLHRNPAGLKQHDLALRLGIEGPTLVRLLDLLEQKEWITRMTVSDDRRRKYAVLTTKATAQIRLIEKLSDELRCRMLGGLSVDEIETGLALMRRIQSNLLEP